MSKYRVIPVIVLPPKSSSFDYRKYMGIIWDERRTIVKSVGVFLLLGLLYFMLSGREYTSEAVLLPEYESDKAQPSGLFANLGLAGALGGGGLTTYRGNSNSLRVQLYPSIVQSVAQINKVIQHKYHVEGAEKAVTIVEYFTDVYQPSFLGYVYMYVAWIPEVILETISWTIGGSSDDSSIKSTFNTAGQQEYIYLTKDELKIVNAMRERIFTNVNMDDYTFSVSVTMPDPELAAQIANVVIANLIDYVDEYRQKKMRQDLEFVEARVAEAEERLNYTRIALAEYKDNNRNVVSEVYRTRESELENEYQLVYSVYSTLVQDVEQKRIEIEEDVDVFKVLEPPNVPVEPSEPRFRLSMLIAGAMGLFLSLIKPIIKMD